MKAVFFSDLHAHKFSKFVTIKEGMHSRLYDALDVLRQILDYCVDNKIKYAIFAGDLFHTKSYLDTTTYASTYNVIEEYRDKVTLIMMPGNHDMADKGKYNSLTPFKGVATVIEEPTILDIDGNKITLVPYMHNKKELRATIKKLKADILILHDLLEGMYYNGVLLDNGLSEKDVLAGGHKRVFLGHIHDPEAYQHDKIKFIGAPLHHNFGDNSDRGFLVYDFDKNEYEFIKTKYPHFFKFTDTTVKKSTQEDLEKLCKDHFVQFELDKPNKIVAQLQKKYQILVKVKAPARQYNNRLDVNAVDTVEEMIEKYVDEFKGNLDKKKLLQIGQGIIGRVDND